MRTTCRYAVECGRIINLNKKKSNILEESIQNIIYKYSRKYLKYILNVNTVNMLYFKNVIRSHKILKNHESANLNFSRTPSLPYNLYVCIQRKEL